MTGLLQFVRANWPPHREPLTWHGCWLVQHPAGAQPSPSWTLRCIVGRLGGRHAMDRRGEARAHARLHGSPLITHALAHIRFAFRTIFDVIYTSYRVTSHLSGLVFISVVLLHRYCTRCYAQEIRPPSLCSLIHTVVGHVCHTRGCLVMLTSPASLSICSDRVPRERRARGVLRERCT